MWWWGMRRRRRRAPRKSGDVVEAAKVREAKAGVRERLAASELGLDVYGMRDKLAARACNTDSKRHMAERENFDLRTSVP